jgi:ribosome-associated translation inhibitor RaiA
MVELVIKNLKEVEEQYHDRIERVCKKKVTFFERLYKRYDKDLVLEVIFDHSASTYKVSASLDMKSKKVLLAKEDKDPLKAVIHLLDEFKKVVKRQYDHERKLYLFKRKRK